MYDDLEFFEALGGRKFRFVCMETPTLMKVWERPVKRDRWNDAIEEYLGGLDVRSVDMETLKKIKVWEELSPDVQKEIIEGLTQKTQAVHSLMEKARAGRRRKYLNVPKEIVCTKCNAKVEVVPSVLVKKVEKLAEQKKPMLFTMDDYIKTYECTKCCPPVRGKKANPMFANLPKELVCKCGNKVALNPYVLKKKADKEGTTMEKLIEGYRCQICNPTIGRRKKTDEEKAVEKKAKSDRKAEKKASKLAKRGEKDRVLAGLPKRGRGRPRKVPTE